MNGREIANAVNTAQTIARFEGKPLQQEHIERVLDSREKFFKKLNNLGKHPTWTTTQGSIDRKGSILDQDENFKS
jgi:hypothetical protein